jgi:hypothetical protein
MVTNHQSPLAKAETHHINNQTMYKLHNSDSTQFSEEQIEQLSLLSKLSKLHLEGEFQKGNWFTHICSMTNLK